MQCYVHLLHEGMVMGVMKTYIFRHPPQKNKDTFSVFQDTELLQVSAYGLRKWSKLEVSPLNTIQLLRNSKVLDLVLAQSQRTRLPIKTPEIGLKTSNCCLSAEPTLFSTTRLFFFSSKDFKSEDKLKTYNEDRFIITLCYDSKK